MKDYLQDTTGDLLITGGDIKLGESTKQHQQDLLIARKCDYKTKFVGIDIYNSLLDDEQENLIGEIGKTFTKDGMTVNEISISPQGKLKTDARYD